MCESRNNIMESYFTLRFIDELYSRLTVTPEPPRKVYSRLRITKDASEASIRVPFTWKIIPLPRKIVPLSRKIVPFIRNIDPFTLKPCSVYSENCSVSSEN